MKVDYLVFGSGISAISAAKLLIKEGQRVAIFDENEIKPETKSILDKHGIPTSNNPSNLDFSKVLVSPGISPSHRFFSEYDTKPVFTDIDLALDRFTGKLIGITGTNGKSTTTMMIHHLLSRLGVSSAAVGNIGVSPCEEVASNKHSDVWVMELSSYQIEWSKPIHCDVVVLTSFSADHLGRHGTVENYFQTKCRLLASNKLTAAYAPANIRHLFKGKSINFVETNQSIKNQKNRFFAQHDILNATLAVKTASSLTEKDEETLIPLLEDFKPLPHRFEMLGTINQFPVINDSKSTNLESTITAIKSIGMDCALFLGGESKGEDFSVLREYGISEILCFGSAAESIKDQLKGSPFPVREFKTLKDAIDSISQIKTAILFSPGCASFDEFENFSKRGDFFRREIESRYSLN